MARIYYNLGECDLAKELLVDALARHAGESNHDVAEMQCTLAGVEDCLGDLTRAQVSAESCISSKESLLGVGHPGTWSAKLVRAGFALEIDAPVTAEQWIDPILAREGLEPGVDPNTTIRALHLKGIARRQVRDYDAAWDFVQRAFERSREFNGD